jgi:hypothetical protein
VTAVSEPTRPARRARRPVVLITAALVGLGGLAGGAGMAFGAVVGISDHGIGHFRIDGDLKDMPQPHNGRTAPIP